MLKLWLTLILIVGIVHCDDITKEESDLRKDIHDHPEDHRGELKNDAPILNYGTFNDFFQERKHNPTGVPRDELHNDGTIHNYGEINNVFEASGSSGSHGHGHGHGHAPRPPHTHEKPIVNYNNYYIDEKNGGKNYFGKTSVQFGGGKEKHHGGHHPTTTKRGKIVPKVTTEPPPCDCEEDSDVSPISDAERIFSFFNDNPDVFVFDEDSSSSSSEILDVSKLFGAKDLSPLSKVSSFSNFIDISSSPDSESSSGGSPASG